MGSIVTFYSYKGGVGRSMALANIGVLLAQRGLRVLLVDWDLEAPGLERYFHYFGGSEMAQGLLPLLLKAQSQGDASWPPFEPYCARVDCAPPGGLDLLPSGRGHDPDYSHNLERFDWEHFFQQCRGGEFLEHLRDRWRSHYDLVLIDSRTGLSDAGGVCTIQMPDIVVAMFTATAQSVYGVRDVMRLAQEARQRLPYERMRLSVLPVPSRWATHEFREGQIWIDRISEAMHEFVADWLPTPLTTRDMVEALKIPQHEYFAYGEKLAVVEQGVTDPAGMGFVYERIASFLASDMQKIGALVGPDTVARAAARAEQAGDDRADASGDQFDVLISHDGKSIEQVLAFSDALRYVLAMYLGRQPRLFIDFTEVRSGPALPDVVAQALHRSRTLIALVTPAYLELPATRCIAEAVAKGVRRMQSAGRLEADAQPRVFPVWLQGEMAASSGASVLDVFLDRTHALDLRDQFPLLRLGQSMAWMPVIVELSEAISLRLKRRDSPAEGPSELAWRGIWDN